MATTQSLPSILLPVAVGAAIGLAAGAVLFASPTCKAPTGVKQVSTNDGSVRVRWQANVDAQAYLVWARDSALLNTDSVTSSITVTGTEAVLPGLEPNHGYQIDVFSICRSKDKDKFNFSAQPFKIGAKSGSIIVEDVVELKTNDCPLNTCDTLVTDTDTCFNWAAGVQNYRIEVFKKNADGVADGTASLRFYLNKDGGNGELRIGMYQAGTPCTGAQATEGTLPTRLACSGTTGCANPQLHYCGQMTDKNNIPVCYGLKIDFPGCCIVGLDKERFKIVVTRCHFEQVNDANRQQKVTGK